MLFDIFSAPFTENGEGFRRVAERLRAMRQQLEPHATTPLDEDIEFHRRLAEVNRRFRERKEAV